MIVSTFQAVSGAGINGLRELETQVTDYVHGREISPNVAFQHQMAFNLIPHIDSFVDNGYTKEEMKMVNETHKIFGDDSIGVSPTTVRVPVQGGHSESINLEFEKEFTLEDVRKMMEETPGVTLQDDPANNVYPMPLYAWGKNDVFVGRFRKDPSVKSGLNFWCVADNLRKGAATNAVQIAEKLIEKGFLPKE
jgi:aspartate-semialdehyde dehydrogenase